MLVKLKDAESKERQRRQAGASRRRQAGKRADFEPDSAFRGEKGKPK
ncbi:hypothetical protein ACNKHQ_25260 [Shigella flexneri]